MPPANGKPRPERAVTDASLGAERDKTDAASAEARTRLDDEADLVVEKARGRADAVLSESRRREDTETAGRGGSAKNAQHKAQQEAQQQARTEEDETIERERSIADRALIGEREEREAALREFLLSERDMTDTHLTLERARADFSVAGRDDFLGMVSHDLRNLLGGIALQAILLKREAPADERGEKLQKRADAVGRLTGRMNRLVGDLLDIASIEAGRLAIVSTQHDAVQLVRDTITAFEPAFAAAGITLSSELAAEPLIANFDFDRIMQVLANLTNNALKFTAPAGSVGIKVRGTSDAVHFTVTDSGPGIPDSLAHRVFERFVQAPENTRRGLGLGLYISRCIVESHGGRIWLERTSPSGSTFCFTLPTGAPSTPS